MLLIKTDDSLHNIVLLGFKGSIFFRFFFVYLVAVSVLVFVLLLSYFIAYFLLFTVVAFNWLCPVVKCEVPTVVKMTALFWVMTLCTFIGRCQSFGGAFCLHLQGTFLRLESPLAKLLTFSLSRRERYTADWFLQF
jgi:hypothetical protein